MRGGTPVLVSAAVDAGRPLDTRCAACRGLGNTGSADAVEPLVRLLEDRSIPGDVRAAAAEALGRIGEPVALEAVQRAAGDKDLHVAREARRARSRLSRASG